MLTWSDQEKTWGLRNVNKILRIASWQSRSEGFFERRILFLLWSTQCVSDSNGSFQCLYIVDLLYWGKFLTRSFPRSPDVWYASLIVIKWTFSTATLFFLLLIFGNFSFLFDWVLFILALRNIKHICNYRQTQKMLL